MLLLNYFCIFAEEHPRLENSILNIHILIEKKNASNPVCPIKGVHKLIHLRKTRLFYHNSNLQGEKLAKKRKRCLEEKERKHF